MGSKNTRSAHPLQHLRMQDDIVRSRSCPPAMTMPNVESVAVVSVQHHHMPFLGLHRRAYRRKTVFDIELGSNDE